MQQQYPIVLHSEQNTGYTAGDVAAKLHNPGFILRTKGMPIGTSQERQAWGGMMGALPGLDGQGATDTIAGSYRLPRWRSNPASSSNNAATASWAAADSNRCTADVQVDE